MSIREKVTAEKLNGIYEKAYTTFDGKASKRCIKFGVTWYLVFALVMFVVVVVNFVEAILGSWALPIVIGIATPLVLWLVEKLNNKAERQENPMVIPDWAGGDEYTLSTGEEETVRTVAQSTNVVAVDEVAEAERQANEMEAKARKLAAELEIARIKKETVEGDR
jgi:hypothetical protein